jgi:hypothetical protein
VTNRPRETTEIKGRAMDLNRMVFIATVVVACLAIAGMTKEKGPMLSKYLTIMDHFQKYQHLFSHVGQFINNNTYIPIDHG